jgi:hypothetical protein
MPAKPPNKLFRNSYEARSAHKMAMAGEDGIYEARFWRAFHEEYPDVAPGAVQSVLEHNWDELDNKPPDQAIDHLVRLAGGGRPQPPPRSNSEEWRNPTPPRNPDAPLTTADIIRRHAAGRREWQDANGYKIEERRRAEAPLDDARKEIARLKNENAASKEDAA